MIKGFLAWLFSPCISCANWCFKRRKLIGHLCLIWLPVALTPSIAIYAKASTAAQEQARNLTIQALLYLKGAYKGPINGSCESETLSALETYKQSLHDERKNSFVPTCGTQAVDILKTDVGFMLTQQVTQDLSTYTSDIGNLNKQIQDIKAAITREHESVGKLTESFSNQFAAQFSDLTRLGVTTLITSLSIIIAAIAFLGNAMIKDAAKDAAEAAHENELKKTRLKLEASVSEASARVFARFGSHCIHLYQDIDLRPVTHSGNSQRDAIEEDKLRRRRNLYESYLQIAMDMSKLGYEDSERMKDSLEQQGMKLSSSQQRIVANCLNNHVFYLSSGFDRATFSDDDKRELDKLFQKLIALLQASSDQPYRWDLQDTRLWANLQMGYTNGADTKTELQTLLSEPTLPDSWKTDLKRRYAFHDDRLPAHDTRKVAL